MRAGARVAAGSGRTFPPLWRVRENKWRASRHGMEADYIVSNDGASMPVRHYLQRTLEQLSVDGFIDPNSRYFENLKRIADGAPTSADRQRALYERTGSFDAVTRALADEFEDDVLASVAAG